MLQEATTSDKRPTKSQLLYGRRWPVLDLERLILLYYYFSGPSISTLLSTISQVWRLVGAESDSVWEFHTGCVYQWDWSGPSLWKAYLGSNPVRCQPESCRVLVAMRLGIYELWPASTLDDNLRSTILHLVTLSITTYWLSRGVAVPDTPTPPPFDRLLRCLAICLADGISANSSILIDEDRVPVSIWENLVWNSVVTVTPQTSIAPVWLLFLLHGADRNFTLTLSQSCNFSMRDKFAKLVLLTGHWGPDKRQIHSSIFIDEDDGGGIVELARSHDWSISLRNLTNFWFAPYADSFRRIYELYQNTSGISTEGLQDLRRELGLDPQCWQSREWGDPQPLLQYQWEDETWILKRSDDDGLED